MESSITAILISITSEIAFKQIRKSFFEYLNKKLGDITVEDEKTRLALEEIENSSDQTLSQESINTIAEAVNKKISDNPVFAEEITEEINEYISKIRSKDPNLATKLEEELQDLNNEIEDINEYIQDRVGNLTINIAKGDYIGRDPFVLSANQKLRSINSSYNIDLNDNSSGATHIQASGHNDGAVNIANSTNFSSDSFFSRRVINQTELLKGKITQYFTVEKSMTELDSIRQPRPLSIATLKISFPLFSVTLFTSPNNKKKNDPKDSNQNKTADEYLKRIRDIESKFGKSKKEDDFLLKDINIIADEINTKISILNNSFILALYPASSSKELVENMASKIGYKELREEADMHLSVISKLTDKLNQLVIKFNIEKLESNDSKKPNNDFSKNRISAINLLLESLDKDDNGEIEGIMKLITELKNNKEQNSCEPTKKSADKLLGQERLYILSDASQAAVGMMIDIEKRKLLVEELVKTDRSRRNQTTSMVTCSIILFIGLISLGVLYHRSQFTIGEQALDQLRLPLLNIPWPVVIWSFIGSFAAMLYRFNRQPIYEFGNVIKWTLTRLVQGVILGSTFYLIIISGLALAIGISPDNINGATSSRISTEIVLVLAFLVGFSDRFADSVFNALIDKYVSATNKNSDSDNKNSA